MGEVLYVSDKDLSAAGGVGQGTLRPTDRQEVLLISEKVFKLAMWFLRVSQIAPEIPSRLLILLIKGHRFYRFLIMHDGF